MGDQLKAEYEIQVIRTGDGAVVATKELQALQATAAQISSPTDKAASSFNGLNTATKATSAGFKILNTTAAAVGFQTFPQLTMSTMLARDAIMALRASGAVLALGVGVMAGAIAGLIVLLITARFAWQAYEAAQFEALTAGELQAQTQRLAGSLRELSKAALEAGKITSAEYKSMIHQLYYSTAAGNEAVRAALEATDQDTSDKRTRMFELQREQIRILSEDTYKSSQQKQAIILDEFHAYQNFYKNLRYEHLITAEDERVLQERNFLDYQKNLNALKREQNKLLTQSVELFASGLASTLVDVQAWTKDAGKAFGDFFASLTKQLAQLIIQEQILKIIGSITGTTFGRGAAQGGMFASALATGGVRFAADGLAGVNSVSSPTYFPKFNVLAGEAGREMLTVLARPKLMQYGGVQAVVGNAGSNRLAITSADQLASSQSAGRTVVEIRLAEGLQADIIQRSVNGAMVSVTQAAQQPSRLRDAIKRGVGP